MIEGDLMSYPQERIPSSLAILEAVTNETTFINIDQLHQQI
jgi:hypothetical protein